MHNEVIIFRLNTTPGVYFLGDGYDLATNLGFEWMILLHPACA